MNMSLEQYEKLNPKCELDVEGTKLIFATPSVFTLWRVESIQVAGISRHENHGAKTVLIPEACG